MRLSIGNVSGGTCHPSKNQRGFLQENSHPPPPVTSKFTGFGVNLFHTIRARFCTCCIFRMCIWHCRISFTTNIPYKGMVWVLMNVAHRVGTFWGLHSVLLGSLHIILIPWHLFVQHNVPFFLLWEITTFQGGYRHFQVWAHACACLKTTMWLTRCSCVFLHYAFCILVHTNINKFRRSCAEFNYLREQLCWKW